jgi:hypothetical protein
MVIICYIIALYILALTYSAFVPAPPKYLCNPHGKNKKLFIFFEERQLKLAQYSVSSIAIRSSLFATSGLLICCHLLKIISTANNYSENHSWLEIFSEVTIEKVCQGFMYIHCTLFGESSTYICYILHLYFSVFMFN